MHRGFGPFFFMEYRRLTTEELEALEQEFVHFLIVNGIEAKDWQRLKEAQDELVWDLIDQFSLMVWEKILGDVLYLDLVQTNTQSFFHFAETEWHLLVMNSGGQSFQSPQEWRDSIHFSPEGIVHTKGLYPMENRNAFIYRLSQQPGYATSKGEWYSALKSILEAQKD
jgi:cag pathogenicity island protein 24